jgi:sugar phosphate isomerase/epimerase
MPRLPVKTCIEALVLSRRQLLSRLARAAVAGTLSGLPAIGQGSRRQRLGVCSISYLLRWPDVDRGRAPAEQVLEFVEHCRELGAGGVQTSLNLPPDTLKLLRAKIEAADMYLEGQIALPRSEGDLDRFETQVRGAKEAGAGVLRTACLGGRRYETFRDAGAFQEFAQQAERSLELAEPVVRKHRTRLAVENHKDWRVPEMLRLLEKISSDFVGICIDTGNSIALLEDPKAVVEAYAPHVFATHLKDMAVQEYEKGFLLSEVALGDGFLDLEGMVNILRRGRTDLQFSLEMIARDPLQVPCLSKQYWATFQTLPGWFLASTLAMVRANPPKQALPHVTGLTRDEKLELEERLVRRSLSYARTHLQL